MLSVCNQANKPSLFLIIGPGELRRAYLGVEILCQQLDPDGSTSFVFAKRNKSIQQAKVELLKKLKVQKLVCVLESLDTPQKARLALEVLDCGKSVWVEMNADNSDSAIDQFRSLLAQSITDSELTKFSADTLSLYWHLMHDASVMNVVSMHAGLKMPASTVNETQMHHSANEEHYIPFMV